MTLVRTCRDDERVVYQVGQYEIPIRDATIEIRQNLVKTGDVDGWVTWAPAGDREIVVRGTLS